MSPDPQVLIPIDERLLALWYLRIDRESDFLAGFSSMEDGDFRFAYRFRYYSATSSNPHDGKDEKANYVVCMPAPQETALRQVRELLRVLTQHAEGELCELMRANRTLPEFFTEIQQQDWAHLKDAIQPLNPARPQKR